MVRVIRHYLSAFVIALAISGCADRNIDYSPNQDPPVAVAQTVWEHQSNPYTSQGSYSIAFSEDVLMVRLKLKLVGYPVTDELRSMYEKGIEDAWSTDRFDLPIVVDVVWTDEDPDKVITVVFGIGRWNTSQWYTAGWVEEIAAHEAGHYFGLFDEYGGGDAQGFDGGAAPGPRAWHPPGLMANHNRPTLDFYYDGFLAWLDERRAS